MKTGINRIHKILLLVIGVLTIILATVLVYKGYRLMQDKKQEQEWAVRHDEVQAQLDDVQLQIQELSGDTEALQAFLDENVNKEVIVLEETQGTEVQEEPEVQEIAVQEEPEVQENSNGWEETLTPDNAEEVMSNAIVIEPAKQENPTTQIPSEQEMGQEEQQGITIEPIPEQGQQSTDETEPAEYSGDAIIIEAPPVPETVETPEQIQQETPQVQQEMMAAQTDSVSENEVVMDETVSGNSDNEDATDETISGNSAVDETTISGNELGNETISGNAATENISISGNAIVNGEVIPYQPAERELTLQERKNIRSSYEETLLVNEADKAVISGKTYDFSGMKIACLGDSLTEGSNLDDLENYQQYSYPSVLKNILGAQSVCNLGIGGSSYGRYWDKAFVDRYKEIPQDTDIILIMGGTNDGFAASSQELGSLEEKAPRTFYGDVDELMRGLKADYPNAKIIFMTPLPNVLHDYLRNQRDYLLPQSMFADAVKELAAQHQIEVIDLYHSNILDTHDTQIIANFMPDGVHGNHVGYQILAEHIASGVIQIMEEERTQETTVSGNTALESVSDNTLPETVSDNAILVIPETNMPEGENVVEDAQLQQEKNEQVAEDAMIIMPTEDEVWVEKQMIETLPEPTYEYGGEAIIIQ